LAAATAAVAAAARYLARSLAIDYFAQIYHYAKTIGFWEIARAFLAHPSP
jgi:hypothetical protein